MSHAFTTRTAPIGACAVPGDNHSDDRVRVYAGGYGPLTSVKVTHIPMCGYHASEPLVASSLTAVRARCPREWNPDGTVWCGCHGYTAE